MFCYNAPSNLLSEKTILITGASDGIGKVCASTFADHGATVILLGRSQEKLKAVYDNIERRHPGKAFLHPMNFSTAKIHDYKILAVSVAQRVGTLDGIIHNAALLGPRTPIEFYPTEDWHQIMQVNVNAVFYLTKELLPTLSLSLIHI